MKIKKILTQTRRDFTAVYICEHCGYQGWSALGYDDTNFHQNVIPNMICNKCNKKAPPDYIPRKTKYLDSEII